jgi:hypothetical protein
MPTMLEARNVGFFYSVGTLLFDELSQINHLHYCGEKPLIPLPLE